MSSSAETIPQLILHVFPSFGIGGVEVRMAGVINHWGSKYRHAIVALDGEYSCRSRLGDGIAADYPSIEIGGRNPFSKIPRIHAVLRRLRPDHLLTYNWGATDWALANMISPICRHVHLESGFGIEEADRQLRRRVLVRRIALARTPRVIVPSRTLVRIATQSWRLDPRKIVHIPNGVDCSKFAAAADPAVRERFSFTPQELIVGTVAPLRPEKDLGVLLRAFAAVSGEIPARLLIVGEGPERPELMALATALNIAERTVFAGHVDAVEEILGCMDVFALTSRTEQMPNGILQAMAAGRAIAAVDVGDVREMLSPGNRAFLAPGKDEGTFATNLTRLLSDKVARDRLGRENQAHVRAQYSQERMFEAYEDVLAP